MCKEEDMKTKGPPFIIDCGCVSKTEVRAFRDKFNKTRLENRPVFFAGYRGIKIYYLPSLVR